MLKYLLGFAIFIFLMIVIRYGLKVAGLWDDKITNKLRNTFTGFSWFYRIPFSIGVIPEYFFWLTIGNNNYFKTNWWALKTSSFITFLLFIAALSNRSEMELYYSLAALKENGIMSYVTSGITFWYLNLITVFYFTVFILIVIESIRMHHWYAPVRIIMYSTLSLLMSVVTFIVLGLIILVTFLYIAYKIIKFLFFSRNKKRREEDDDEDVSETLNNNYRVFRAELYAWEDDLKSSRSFKRKERETSEVRKRPKIRRKHKTKPKDNDIPRFHPE
jgi:hypothetical protein